METVLSADGTTITFDVTGEGPPLVLLHGTGRDKSYWVPSLPDLASGATVHSVDRRGRGRSGDTNIYAIEREIDDVLAVIAAIDEPVFLLGHSYGAILALEAALRTHTLLGLILYEPPFSVGSDQVPTHLGDTLDALLASGDRDEVLVTFLREGPRYPPEVIAAQREQPDWPQRLDYAHTLAREVQAVHRYTFSPTGLAAMQVPGLLLLGSESPPFFRQAIEALDTALPESSVVVFQGQHHNAVVTAPALFAGEVRRFIHAHQQRRAISS